MSGLADAGVRGRRVAIAARVASYLDLAWVLSRKNFQIRYKRASIGVLWAVLQPAFQAAVLSFVFIRILRIGTVPHFPLYVLSGVLPWSFFTSSTLAAMTAVVDNGALVRKVAVPLSVFPVSAVGGAALAYASSLLVLVAAAFAYGVAGWGVLLLLAAFVIQVEFIIGVALLTGAFHVAFRDIKYVVESSLLVGFYSTPILYPLERVPPGTLRTVIRANPMTGVLSLTRRAVLDRPIDWPSVVSAVAVSTVLLAIGGVCFRRRAGEFADLV